LYDGRPCLRKSKRDGNLVLEDAVPHGALLQRHDVSKYLVPNLSPKSSTAVALSWTV
jgi:hypothetical protein